ncbi:MAG TPA: hypothetical protein VH352_20655 [Pseudonocardiaceae bacterium]|nr:hypothetical protein [Pseudonocardiaceae bacterium]
MPRPSPFADLADSQGGPAPDAVVVELGRPTRAALGCFGLTTLFLAAVALAALSYAVFREPGPRTAPPSLRVVAAVLGGIFLLIVLGLGTIAVKAVRSRQGMAVDADAVWWRADRTLVRLPWSDIAAVRLVTPIKIRGQRTSTPRTPAVELCPVDEQTVRRYPALADRVTGGEPARPGLPALRFAFRLPSVEDGPRMAEALARFAPVQWAAGTTAPAAD